MRHSRIAPDLSTPGLAGDLRGLPAEVLEQTCRRVGLAAMVFAGVWTWVLLMNTVALKVLPNLVEVDRSRVLAENALTVAGIGIGTAF